jgi:hypothetical protein
MSIFTLNIIIYPSILQVIPSSNEHVSSTSTESLSFCDLAVSEEKIISQKNETTAMNAIRKCCGTTPKVN